MFAEFYQAMKGWVALDSWIVVTGAVAAMSCALPGAWLLLRRQSLLGDALSHSILPGIVLAYLAQHALATSGWVTQESEVRQILFFIGAAASGVFSAVATELIQRWGRLDRGAAIGVVFTTMFALGLLLIRMFADKTDIDPGCVLFGNLATSALVPMSALMINGAMLVINGILVVVFFKELRLSTFDAGLARAIGLPENGIQLVLMAMTAATLVAAFQSVGVILVIAMLIVPPATARLLTDRLAPMLILSLLIAALSALLGHVGAITLPAIVFSRLGYADVNDASTPGMMAVASGCLFLLAIIASPRHGMIRYFLDRIRLKIRIAGEDELGRLYRHDESMLADQTSEGLEIAEVAPNGTWIGWLAQKRLMRRGLITVQATSAQLTDTGRESAKSLVRSHRLWEAYMAKHFVLPGDHLHATAEQVEHFLCPELQTELAEELDQPSVDPHGKAIPRSTP